MRYERCSGKQRFSSRPANPAYGCRGRTIPRGGAALESLFVVQKTFSFFAVLFVAFCITCSPREQAPAEVRVTQPERKAERPTNERQREAVRETADMWIARARMQDVEALIGMSSDPFFYDRTTSLSGNAVRASYEKLVKTEGFDTSTVDSVEVQTLGELAAVSEDARMNELATAFSLTSSDWVAQIALRKPSGDRDKAALFIRVVETGPRVVAYWD